MPDSRMTLVGRATGATGGWPVAGRSWPVGQALPPNQPSAIHPASVDRSEATMSKLARTLVFAATLAAMNLAGMTAVAQANDQPARRPPTQGQVGESWHQRQVTAEQPNIASDARRPPTQSQVGESWRHQTDGPAQPVEPGGLPSWIMASLGLLAAGLAVAGGLAVLAARRAGRRARVGHAA
jgi:hypothetical protein